MTRKILTTAAALILAACGDSPTGHQEGPRGVARVDVTAPAGAVEVGATLQLAATPRDAAGRPLSGHAVAWTSGNEAVATVSPAGLVTARAAGNVVITASAGGRAGSATLTVRDLAVASVQLSPAGEITQEVGTTRQLGVTVRAADGRELFGRSVSWTMSDATVAGVGPSGVVEALATGTAVVTATVEGKTAEVTVRVPSRVERVEMDPASATLEVNELLQVAARPRGRDGGVVQAPVEWSSTNPAVATVDAAGRVKAVAVGTAVIHATSEGKTGATQVTVSTWGAWRTLLAVGDSALPATLYTQRQTSGGVTRVTRFEATSGALRQSSAGSRYELRIGGWLHFEGQPSTLTELGIQGTYLYDMNDGSLILERAGGIPPLRGRVRPDGTLAVTGRFAPYSAEVTIVFSRQ